MERMGDILARAASRRAGAPRKPPMPASPSQSGQRPRVTPLPAAARTTPPPAAADAAQTRTPRSATKAPTTPAAPPVAAHAPTASRPAQTPDARPEAAIRPGADVLDGERILELPARRPQPAPAAARDAGRETARPSARTARPRTGADPGMSALREVAATYVARLSREGDHTAPDGDVPRADVSAQQKHSLRARRDMAGEGPRPEPAVPLAPDVCPVCRGAGYVRLDVPVGDPAFGQAVRCVCKEREVERRDRSNLRRLSNLDPFRDKTFASFDSSLPGMGEAYEVARHYADDPMGWLIFRGGYGCGKTHLAAAIANAAEQAGVPVVFAIVPDLLDHLRAAFAPSSETTYDALFDKVREVQLLVLDDFGAENGTAWATEKLFQLINYRYNYRMPTVITTNTRLLSHMDERIRSRLSDIGLVRAVNIEAADYRERHSGRPRYAPASGRATPRRPAR